MKMKPHLQSFCLQQSNRRMQRRTRTFRLEAIRRKRLHTLNLSGSPHRIGNTERSRSLVSPSSAAQVLLGIRHVSTNSPWHEQQLKLARWDDPVHPHSALVYLDSRMLSDMHVRESCCQATAAVAGEACALIEAALLHSGHLGWSRRSTAVIRAAPAGQPLQSHVQDR